jgi:hypothetical protein
LAARFNVWRNETRTMPNADGFDQCGNQIKWLQSADVTTSLPSRNGQDPDSSSAKTQTAIAVFHRNSLMGNGTAYFNQTLLVEGMAKHTDSLQPLNPLHMRRSGVAIQGSGMSSRLSTINHGNQTELQLVSIAPAQTHSLQFVTHSEQTDDHTFLGHFV